MTSEEMRAYWDQPHPGGVAAMTGAAAVLDCADLRDALTGLTIALPLGCVLDVGCGTGRVAQLCREWWGVDVSWRAVTHCRQHGLLANLISEPSDLPEGYWDTIVCFSVFTHIERARRVAYLREFATRAAELVVDILPGAERESIPASFADPAGFEADLLETGWEWQARYDRVSPDGATHRYYHCVLGGVHE